MWCVKIDQLCMHWMGSHCLLVFGGWTFAYGLAFRVGNVALETAAMETNGWVEPGWASLRSCGMRGVLLVAEMVVERGREEGEGRMEGGGAVKRWSFGMLAMPCERECVCVCVCVCVCETSGGHTAGKEPWPADLLWVGERRQLRRPLEFGRARHSRRPLSNRLERSRRRGKRREKRREQGREGVKKGRTE